MPPWESQARFFSVLITRKKRGWGDGSKTYKLYGEWGRTDKRLTGPGDIDANAIIRGGRHLTNQSHNESRGQPAPCHKDRQLMVIQRLC